MIVGWMFKEESDSMVAGSSATNTDAGMYCVIKSPDKNIHRHVLKLDSPSDVDNVIKPGNRVFN